MGVGAACGAAAQAGGLQGAGAVHAAGGGAGGAGHGCHVAAGKASSILPPRNSDQRGRRAYASFCYTNSRKVEVLQKTVNQSRGTSAVATASAAGAQ